MFINSTWQLKKLKLKESSIKSECCYSLISRLLLKYYSTIIIHAWEQFVYEILMYYLLLFSNLFLIVIHKGMIIL